MGEYTTIFSEADHEELWDEIQSEECRATIERLGQQFADERTFIELDAELDSINIDPTL